MKTRPYHNFWQKIHKAAREKSFPLRVMFELTYQCNFRCKHCYVPDSYRKKKELKAKEVFFILDQLKEAGCFYLGFTGGEPFVRKDIMDILWHAKKKGFEVIIYTNGSLIDEGMAKELKHLRPNKVDITIPGISKVAFEAVSGVCGSRDKTFKAIDLLHKKRVNLGFKTCVLKENEDEISRIQDFAASLGALHRLDDMLSWRLDGSDEPFKYRGTLKQNPVNSQQSVVSSIKECDLQPDSKTISPKPEDLFKCGAGASQAAITSSGELKMCVMIDYPKYKIITENGEQGTGLKEAWKRLKELAASIQPDENYKCNKCNLEPYCKWCPGRGWLYSKSFTSCDPESRTWAEFRRNGTSG